MDFLLEQRVTGALVADSKGELAGILTESDCLKLLTPAGVVWQAVAADAPGLGQGRAEAH